MRALLVAFILAATVGRAATSVDDPRTTAELEQFYGAKYPKISERECEKLARGAIKAQHTGICNLHHVRMQKRRVPVHYGLVVTDDPYYLPQLCWARQRPLGRSATPSFAVAHNVRLKFGYAFEREGVDIPVPKHVKITKGKPPAFTIQ